jgi:type VI secretion system FHA domain protein
MPPDYNPLRPVPASSEAPPPAAAPAPAPAAAPAPAPAPTAGLDLRALLSGAGLENVPVTPEVARQFGQILRVVVTGVLDVLHARQEVKGAFRIKPTMIQARRNNPLKHSTDTEDALHNLLLKHGPAYLGPVEAFEHAFKDLRNHQIAMLAGMREAFDAMFGQFDPDRLQKEFDRHTPRVKKGSLAAALQSKPDYWEFYRDWVQRLSNDPDGTFRNLFGQEFARAYEEQLDRLESLSPAIGEAGRTGDRRRER